MADSATMDVFACNRQPFLSGDGCDRGNVNIHQFDDLPYCEPIDPTSANIPPELVDVLQIPITPPPCACVNINYTLKFKYSKQLKFEADFKSRGDCCDGNYQTDFDIELPCPIKKIDKKWYKQKLKWNPDTTYYEQIYIQDDKDCGLEPFDIDFELGLKCPVRTNGEKTISIGLDWGNKQDKQKKKYVNTQNDEDDCAITPNNVDFDLELPCPISDVSDEMKIKIGWGEGKKEDTGDIKINKVEDCGLDIEAPEFDLALPCPIQNVTKDMKIELKWQDKKSDTRQIKLIKKKECELDMEAPEFDLGLPCPIKTVGKNIKIDINWKDKKSDTKPIKLIKKEECELDLETKDFDIGLPCPIPSGDVKLRPTIKWGQRFTIPNDVILVKGVGGSKCETTFYDQPFDIEIPCPLDNLTFSGSITDGEENSITITKTPGANCGLDVAIDIVVAGGDAGPSECDCIQAKESYEGELIEGCACAAVARIKIESDTSSSFQMPSRKRYYAPEDFSEVVLEENGCCGGPPNDGVFHPSHTIKVIRISKNTWKKYASESALPSKVYETMLTDFEYECGDPGCSSSSSSSSSSKSSSSPSSSLSSSPSSSTHSSSHPSSPNSPSSHSPDSHSPDSHSPGSNSPDSNSPDSHSPGSNSHGSNSPGDSPGDSPSEDICFDKIASFSATGPTLTITTTRVCLKNGKLVEEGAGQSYSATLPTATHVNKCCDCADSGTDGG